MIMERIFFVAIIALVTCACTIDEPTAPAPGVGAETIPYSPDGATMEPEGFGTNDFGGDNTMF